MSSTTSAERFGPFRKLRTRYILLAADAVFLVLCIVWMFSTKHPLGSPGHLLALIFAAVAGLLWADILCDRFLLKLYADSPNAPEVRGLL